jgi:DNA polymerase delta subunit 1
MVNLGPDIILEDVIKYGKLMAALCTAKFEKPNTLNFEAVKLRAGFVNKKRYFALQIERLIPGERFAAAILRAEIAVKGLEGKRRDNALIGSDTQNAIIEILLRRGDVAAAVEYVRNIIVELLENRVDVSKLVISKALSKTDDQYAKGSTKQQHVELRDRMQKRAHFTGEAVPATGDRVPFLMLSGPAKKTGKGASKAHSLSENPVYAQKTGAPIDKTFYLEKQIWPATARILTCVYEPLMCMTIHSAMSQEAKERLKVYQLLFRLDQPHMKHRVQARSRGFGISAYTKPLPQCLGCGVIVGPLDAVCRHCNLKEVRAKKEAEYSIRRSVHDASWDICRKCQPGKHENIKRCAAVTCSNYFARDRTSIDVADIEDDMRRFAVRE